ncbi:aspartate aminotransferase family protein [Thalassospira sp.]|uniref:aspartate aminotransferase family protein n=1 Tax=Thalassospira sp. TaxID=1912094 RepID=UPI0027352272|nr:aspartate aminotransferase family protein [Thalassospira sp.]MDP2697716.1 aspartate aminotransferase family protein [Thalassospira sp.]
MNQIDKTTHWQNIDQQHHMHPFTDTADLNARGTRIITKAQGVYIEDSHGKRYIDGMAGLWCVNVGYGRKELADVASRQMMELPYYNNFFQCANAPAIELSQVLADITPDGLNHVFYANSGSEANDTVVRMVRQYWKLKGQPDRSHIISRHNAYHGSTIAGASLGGMAGMHSQGGPMLPNVAHIMQPYWFGEGGDHTPDEFGLIAARALEDKILELGADKVGAFIGEPIQGAGGVIIPPATYWPEIQRICDKYDILLVVDEVICGFGRTGNWFGSDTFDIKPDLMPMAKGMSSGYLPISAVMVGDRVADVLINQCGEFTHGFTYSGHPVCAAVALENIRIIRDEKLVERVRDDIGPYLRKKLASLADHPLVGAVESVGLIAGMPLVSDKKTRKGFEKPGTVGTICRDFCVEHGVIMRACGDRMVMSPPLVISHSEIDEIVEKATAAFDATARKIGKM